MIRNNVIYPFQMCSRGGCVGEDVGRKVGVETFVWAGFLFVLFGRGYHSFAPTQCKATAYKRSYMIIYVHS